VTSLKRHTSATQVLFAHAKFFTSAQGLNKQIPRQYKRGIFLFWETAWPEKVLQSKQEQTAEFNDLSQPDASARDLRKHCLKRYPSLTQRVGIVTERAPSKRVNGGFTATLVKRCS
jgi:hypothetical protein